MSTPVPTIQIGESLRTQLANALNKHFDGSVSLEKAVDKVLGLCGICALDPLYVSSRLREHGNYTLGVLLTAVEAALGDSKQAEALKSIVKREMFLMIDRNQAEHYESLGIQSPGLAPPEMPIDGQDDIK